MVKVFIISDEEYVKYRVGEIIDKLNLKYEISGNAQQVREKLTEGYDIVISDALIWGMTAIEVVDIARKHNPNVCVIVMSDLATSDIAEKSLKNGAFAYVLKPQEIERIKTYVELYLITRKS